MHKLKNNKVECCIKLPDGTQVPIVYVGDVQLCDELVLKETLVVLAFKYNMLSMSKLSKDNNCTTVFHEEVCLF